MRKNPGILELVIALGAGVTGISFFAAMQTRQPYALTQIQFCPRSANHPAVIADNVAELNKQREKKPPRDFWGRPKKTRKAKIEDFDSDGQAILDQRYCYKPRYVLAEEWKRYGKFGGKIPFKGDAIFRIADVAVHNSNYVFYNAGAITCLWIVTGCVLFRVNKLQRRDFEFSEQEKSIAYKTWLDEVNNRDINQFNNTLDLELTKEVRQQKHQMMREQLGVADTENEAIRNRLQMETTLLQRETHHAQMKKTIAENLRDAAKADKERQKVEGKQVEAEAEAKGKDKLIEMLKEHEGGWLWKVVNFQKPVWVIGSQGSGKSTLTACLALIREHCLGIPVHFLIDKHAGRNIQDAWKFLHPKEIAQTITAIADGLQNSVKRWDDRINSGEQLTPLQTIVDEFTNLSQIEATKEQAAMFFRASLSDPRKAKEYILGIAHYFTKTATGGGEGMHQGKIEGCITIKRKTANGQTPLPNALLTGIYDEEGEPVIDQKVTIPAWMRPEKLAEMLGAQLSLACGRYETTSNAPGFSHCATESLAYSNWVSLAVNDYGATNIGSTWRMGDGLDALHYFYQMHRVCSLSNGAYAFGSDRHPFMTGQEYVDSMYYRYRQARPEIYFTSGDFIAHECLRILRAGDEGFYGFLRFRGSLTSPRMMTEAGLPEGRLWSRLVVENVESEALGYVGNIDPIDCEVPLFASATDWAHCMEGGPTVGDDRRKTFLRTPAGDPHVDTHDRGTGTVENHSGEGGSMKALTVSVPEGVGISQFSVVCWLLMMWRLRRRKD
ncbi:MAG: hypothetical protein ACFB2X_15045 [Rivularia sp. (in: cyanobacteria)]